MRPGLVFFFQAEDGIRDVAVTGVQTCALPISFGPPDARRPTIQLLEDSSDVVASQVVSGLLQKIAMTSLPDVMVEQGSKYRSEEHTSELQSRLHLVCRLLLEKKKEPKAAVHSHVLF